jgi:hypothetical protein
VFTSWACNGQALIEVIMPDARHVPPYRLINGPFRELQERGCVKPKATMTDVVVGKGAAAQGRCGGACNAHRRRGFAQKIGLVTNYCDLNVLNISIFILILFFWAASMRRREEIKFLLTAELVQHIIHT